MFSPQSLSFRINKESVMSWVVCLSAGLFFFYDFIQLNVMSSIGVSLMQEFSLSATALGQSASIYLDAQVICLLFVGYLLDRVSTRKLILIGMSLLIMSTAWCAAANSLWMFKCGRAIGGAVGSFCFLSCIVLATRWFSTTQMATVTGVIGSMAMLGGAMAQRPMDMLVSGYGWRWAMVVNALFGLLLLVWMYMFVLDAPDGKQHSRKAEQLPFFKSIKEVLRCPQNWLAGGYTALMNSVVFVLGAVWGTQYLMQVHQLSHAQATNVTMMIFFGTTIGAPLAGAYSDRLGLRRKPMVYGAILSLLLILPLMVLNSWSVWSLGVIFFMLGLITSTQIITYAVIFESNKPSIVGLCESMAAVIIMGAGSFLQPFFGIVMDMGHVASHITYTTADYQAAICIFPACFILSCVMALFLRETHCQSKTLNES